MKILISGGAGFIGCKLSIALAVRGHEVTVLDSLAPQIHGTDAVLPAALRDVGPFFQADVRSHDAWQVALRGQDAVVHLAAETGTGQSMYEIDRYVSVNVSGTAALLEALAKPGHGVRRLLVASSRAIYGEGKYDCPNCGVVYPSTRQRTTMAAGDFDVRCPTCAAVPRLCATDEDSRLHPTSLYGITKHTQEQMMLVLGRSLGISTTALRYQNVYGPGQSLSNPYTGILSIFSTRIRNGNEILLFEDGRESRDFVYVDDVVSATIAALEHSEPLWDALNVGSGVGTSVEEVAMGLIAAYRADVAVRITGTFRVGDIRHNVADLAKIGHLLGYRPSVAFHTGLSRFAEWVASQPLSSDHFDRSIQELRDKGLYT